VEPLLELLDEYEPYAVALVDKEKARFFSIFLGEIEETDDFQRLRARQARSGLACRRQTFSATMRRTSSGT